MSQTPSVSTRRRFSHTLSALAAGLLLATANPVAATDFNVANASQISSAMNSAQPGDVLIMADGMWPDQDIDFAGDGTSGAPITLRAETPGGVQLSGTSQLSISGSYLVVDGLNFEGGGDNSLGYIIQFRGSDGDADNCRLTNTQILNYNPSDSSHQYHWVEIFGQDNRVDHCLFQGQNHQGVTLVVRLDNNGQAARHQIDYNAFLDRPEGDGNGHETIRIGTSARQTTSAQVVVENNLFQNADGEIEIISNKSGDNIFRYNTFRSCAGTLTLRHGKGATVDSNFFLGENKARSGAIRVIDSDHVIVNNYIADIDDRANAAISLVAGIDGGPVNGYEPVKNVDIHNNTIVDVGGAAIIFDWGFGDTDNGGIQDQLPENISIINNLIRSSPHVLFEGQEGSGWTWTNNIAFGASLGISARSGLQTVDPIISVDATGLWRPASNSPAVDGGTTLSAVTIDMDGQARIGLYDIGADENSSDAITLTPLTVDDVGPIWDLPQTTAIVDDSFADGITNSGAQQIGFNVTSSNAALDLAQAAGPMDFATGDSGRTIHGLFPAQTLAAFGDILTVTFDFTTPDTLTYDGGTNGTTGSGSISTNEDFKFGLFDTSQTTLANGNVVDVNTDVEIDFTGPVNTSSGTPNAALNPLAGFFGEIDNINAAGTDLGIRTHNVNGITGPAAAPSGQFLNSNTGFDFISGGANDVITLVPNTNYVGSISVAFTDATLTSLDVTIGMMDAAGVAFTDSHTDTILIADDPGNEVGVNTTTFDLLAFHATSGAFGGTVGPIAGSSSTGDANNGIDISNIKITFDSAVTAVLLGDVNLDGTVDFLDISPFISVLSGGTFQAEADCDESGEVDFLDISPFIAILSGS